MSIYETSRDRLPTLGEENPGGSLVLLTTALEALAHLGKREEAAALSPLMNELLESGSVILFPTGGLIAKTAGIGAAAAENWDEAESHFQTALEQAEQLPHRLEQPEVRRWYARMLLARGHSGDQQRARELLREALAVYKSLGMPLYVDMAEALFKSGEAI